MRSRLTRMAMFVVIGLIGAACGNTGSDVVTGTAQGDTTPVSEPPGGNGLTVGVAPIAEFLPELLAAPLDGTETGIHCPPDDLVQSEAGTLIPYAQLTEQQIAALPISAVDAARQSVLRLNDPTIERDRADNVANFIEVVEDSENGADAVIPWIQGDTDGLLLARFRMILDQGQYYRLTNETLCLAIWYTPIPREFPPDSVPTPEEIEEAQRQLDDARRSEDPGE